MKVLKSVRHLSQGAIVQKIPNMESWMSTASSQSFADSSCASAVEKCMQCAQLYLNLLLVLPGSSRLQSSTTW